MIVDFVKKGGVVIADFAPARLNENLAIRKQNPLAALFGNQVLQPGKKYVVKPISIPGLKASKALVDPNRKMMEVKTVGKGKAILTNFNFAIVETAADKTTPFAGFMKDLLVKNGAYIPFSQSNPEPVFRVRTGKDFALFGVYNNKNKTATTIKLPARKFIYAVGKGFLANTNTVNVKFSEDMPMHVFAAFDKKQSAPEVKIPASVKAGENIVIQFNNIPAGRTVAIRVIGPDGNELFERVVVLNTNDGKSYSFGVPYNAAKGNYKFTVKDYVTGLSAEKTVVVK